MPADFGFSKIFVPESGNVNVTGTDSLEFVELGDTDPPLHVSPFISFKELRSATQVALDRLGQNIKAPDDPAALIRMLTGTLKREEIEQKTRSFLATVASWLGVSGAFSIDPSALVRPLLFTSGALVATTLLWNTGNWEYIPVAIAGSIIIYSATDEPLPSTLAAVSGDELTAIATFLNGGVKPADNTLTFARLRHAVGSFSKKSELYYFLVDDMPTVSVGHYMVPTSIRYTNSAGQLLPTPVFGIADGIFKLDHIVELLKRSRAPVAMRRLDMATGATVTVNLQREAGDKPGLPLSLLDDIIDAAGLDSMYMPATVGVDLEGNVVVQQESTEGASTQGSSLTRYIANALSKFERFSDTQSKRYVSWSTLGDTQVAIWSILARNRDAYRRGDAEPFRWAAKALEMGWATTAMVDGHLVDYNFLDLPAPGNPPIELGESFRDYVARIRQDDRARPVTWFDVLVKRSDGVLPPPSDFMNYSKEYKDSLDATAVGEEATGVVEVASPAQPSTSEEQTTATAQYRTRRRVYVPRGMFI